MSYLFLTVCEVCGSDLESDAARYDRDRLVATQKRAAETQQRQSDRDTREIELD